MAGSRFRFARATLIASALAFAAHAEIKALKNFTLIDGNGGAPVANAVLVMDNGRISAAGPAAKVKIPAGAQTVDLAGAYVMPGIINLHGHVGNTIDLKQDAKFFTPENVEKNLRTYASYGVTTVASMGTDGDYIFKLRDQQRRGRPHSTRVFTAGQGFLLKGGYGGLAGITPGVSSPADVPAQMDKLAREHVDYVKLWVDDHLGRFQKIPFAISKAIIDSGHQHNLPVVAHIFYLSDAKQLAGAGLNAFVHSVRDRDVDAQLIGLMKEHGTWQAASTLSREMSMFVYAKPAPFLKDPFFTRSVSPSVLATLKSASYQQKIAADPDYPRYRGFFETAKRNLKRLADAGISFGMGTDTGPPGRFPGFFEQVEMELMVDAGLTPSQVITAATKSGAQFLKATDLGTLERGKWADLLVLKQSPLENIRNTRTIEAVYIAGNRVQ